MQLIFPKCTPTLLVNRCSDWVRVCRVIREAVSPIVITWSSSATFHLSPPRRRRRDFSSPTRGLHLSRHLLTNITLTWCYGLLNLSPKLLLCHKYVPATLLRLHWAQNKATIVRRYLPSSRISPSCPDAIILPSSPSLTSTSQISPGSNTLSPTKMADSPSNKPEDNPVSEHLNIKVTDNNNEVFFKIKRTTALKKLMDAFCERQGKAPNSVRFLFEGQRVNPTDNPELVSGYPHPHDLA